MDRLTRSRFALTPVRTAAPAVRPITVDEARAHLRIDHHDDDVLIDALVDAAVDHLDGINGVLGRALVTQSWRASYHEFPSDGMIPLPLAPVQSVTSIVYTDTAGDEQTLAVDRYYVQTDAARPFVERAEGTSWPEVAQRSAAVRVTAVYGYGDAATDVPAPIRHALLMIVADAYEYRETVAVGVSAAPLPMSATVDRLLLPYRRFH